MVSVDELATLSERQRAEMLRALLTLTVAPVAQRWLWQRRILIVAVMTFAALVLGGWIVYLILALPMEHAAGWRFAWVGFDVAELGLYVATAWAAWRSRRVVVPALFTSAILLLCDAWFDMSLSWRTAEWASSVVLGLGVELPMAVVLILLATRIRCSLDAAVRAAIAPVIEPAAPAAVPALR